MSSDVTTLPLRDRLLDAPRRLRAAAEASAEPRSPARVRSERRDRALVIAALIVIVTCSGAIVLAGADRPSLLAATSHPHYFPRWMAGPLGGLWPTLTRNGMVLKDLFSLALVVMFVCWVVALRRVAHVRARWAIGALVAVNLIFLLAPPLSLTDVFNYINYARMEVIHHLNPYSTIPALEPHGDPSFALSNWHGLFSPYGPLFTIMTFALVPLGVAGSFWAMKAILVASSLAIAALIWRCARLVGRDPVQVLIFTSLNPIVLVWGLGGDHNDFLMVLFIVLALYLLLRAGAFPTLTARAGAGKGRSEQAEVADALAHLANGNGHARAGARAAGGNGNGHTGNGNGQAANGNGHSADGNARGNGHDHAPNDNGHSWSGGDALEGGGAAAVAVAPRLRLPGALAVAAQRGGPALSRVLPPEAFAGAALATAVAIKASAAILLPVVVAGLWRSGRRLVWLLAGLVLAGLVLAVASYLAFGPHLPDLGTQGTLVTSVSVPNLVGLALTLGGENATLHVVLTVAMVATLLACCVSAWRTRDAITAAGWATLALVVTLSWVLPWYVVWVLPLAALSRSRRLRIATVVLGAYLILTWMPVTSSMRAAIGFHPEKTLLGRFHQREVRELMN